MPRIAWLRIVRLTVLGMACTLGLFGIMLLPDLIRLIPERIRAWWVEALSLFCLIVYAIARLLASVKSGGRPSTELARAGLRRVDFFTDRALKDGLALALGLLCLGLVLVWVPHYLTWPWSRDQETFAVLAQSWDQGILPYRDIRAYNFPGATYISWVLGKVFGWGHTVPLYAFDAGCIVLLGAALNAWSRRRMGGAIPGLIGYLAFLTLYLNLHYENVVERDWHTALLMCLALMVLQAWPGRFAQLASALAAALALTIRPHAVLFLPALLWEVAQGPDSLGENRSKSKRIRAVTHWCMWMAIFVTMAFAPLVLAGIAGDFVRGLRVVAYGGPYSKTTPADMMRVFVDQLTSWKTDVPLIATLLAAARPREALSRMAASWSLALLAALLYKPIHPVHHSYLIIPIALVSSITWAFAVSWLLSLHRLGRPVLVLAIALLVYEIMPARPDMCSVTNSLSALPPLLLGETPPTPPLGCLWAFGVRSDRWDNYREVLSYIGKETSPKTLVANVLNRFPYESLNGSTGRLSPFLAESGICWMSHVDIDLDPEFAESLIAAADSVVVWSPSESKAEPRLKLERVIAVTRQYYEPAARFGRVEVWKRKAPGGRHSP
jgi:hypothetical protein